MNVSLLLRHALGLRQFQEFRRWLAEATSEGGNHSLLEAWMGVKVDDGVEDRRSLENEDELNNILV